MAAKLSINIESASSIKRDRTPDMEANFTPVFPREGDPLIPTGTRKRTPQPRYVPDPDDWDDSLPYGGKVYLARRKKPDTWLCILIQVAVVAFAIGLVIWAWFYTEHMHYHVTKAYAHIGNKDAQALIGHKLLNGHGVESDHEQAMDWFKKASDQGHPHAAYNLAVGHLQGIKTPLEQGEARKLIEHAASHGIPEAQHVLSRVCSKGRCDD